MHGRISTNLRASKNSLRLRTKIRQQFGEELIPDLSFFPLCVSLFHFSLFSFFSFFSFVFLSS